MSETTMKQIVAPPPRPGEEPMTPEQVKELTTWRDDDGWCSACRGEERPVALMGNLARSLSFGLCGECLKKMTDAIGWKGIPESFDAQKANDEITRLRARLADEQERANAAADQNGSLRAEKTGLLVENAELRRELESARRSSRRDLRRGTP